MFIRVNRKEIGEIISTTLNVSEIRYFEPMEVDEGQPAETRVFLKGESPRQFILLCTEAELGQAIDATRDFRNKTMPDLTTPQLTMKREYTPQMLGRLKPTRSIEDHPLELWESLSLVNDDIFQRPGKYILAHCLFDEKEMDLFFRTDVEITPEGLAKVLPFLNAHIYDYFPEGSPDRSYAIRVPQVAAVDIEHNAGSPYDKRVAVMDIFNPGMGIIWPGMNTVRWLQPGTPDDNPRHHRSEIMFTAENPGDLKQGDLRLVVNTVVGPAIYRVENWPQVGRGYAFVEYLKANREKLGLGNGTFALIRVAGQESNGDVRIAEEYSVGKKGWLTTTGLSFDDGLDPRGFGTTKERQEEMVPDNAVRFTHGVMGITERLQEKETYVLITTENKDGNRHDEIHWSNPLPQPEHLVSLKEELQNLPTVQENDLNIVDVRLITALKHYDSHVLVFDKVAQVDGVLYRNEPQVVWEQARRAIINEQRLYPVTPETMVNNHRAVLLCVRPDNNQAPLIAMYRIHEWLAPETLDELLKQHAGEQAVMILQVDWKGKFFGNGPFNFYSHPSNIAGTVDNGVVSLHPDISA